MPVVPGGSIDYISISMSSEKHLISAKAVRGKVIVVLVAPAHYSLLEPDPGLSLSGWWDIFWRCIAIKD